MRRFPTCPPFPFPPDGTDYSLALFKVSRIHGLLAARAGPCPGQQWLQTVRLHGQLYGSLSVGVAETPLGNGEREIRLKLRLINSLRLVAVRFSWSIWKKRFLTNQSCCLSSLTLRRKLEEVENSQPLLQPFPWTSIFVSPIHQTPSSSTFDRLFFSSSPLPFRNQAGKSSVLVVFRI